MTDGTGDGSEGQRSPAEAEREAPIPTDRESPVGAPVIRGDETVIGERAREAVGFDPEDPESVARARETVRDFAKGGLEDDRLQMLRGAAACAALVRGVGSYTAAADRAGGGVTVSFVRKWSRVHDLPRSVRAQVARGEIAPSAAKHIARLQGEDRLLLAWATIDAGLSVREVRTIASEVADGADIEAALAAHDVTLGSIELDLPADVYRDLRRQAALEGVDPARIVADALRSRSADRNV